MWCHILINVYRIELVRSEETALSGGSWTWGKVNVSKWVKLLTTFQCMIRCLLQLIIWAHVLTGGPFVTEGGGSWTFLRCLGWSGHRCGGWGAGWRVGRCRAVACTVILWPLSIQQRTISFSEKLSPIFCLLEQYRSPSSNSPRGGPQGGAGLWQAIGNRLSFTVQNWRRWCWPLLCFSAINVLCGAVWEVTVQL